MPYLIKRLLLIIPTLWAIMTLNFVIVQFVPGGPVDQIMANMKGAGASHMQNLKNQISDGESMNMGQSINEENRQKLIKQYGFDQPTWVRYTQMLKNYALFDLGDSYYQNQSVYHLIIQKLPVSASLGIWSTLLIYLIAITMGIRKAVSHGSRFDILTSMIVIILNAIPVFVMAILMLTLFSGGYFFDIFPLKGLVSNHFDTLSWPMKIIDYLWHITLPVTCIVLTGLATLMFLTKNSFLEQIKQQYVTCAYAKGLDQQSVLYKHVFRNAMLIIISGFPASFIGMFFTGSLMIEIIFSLDGLGLLGYNAINQLDYPVVFGTLYLFSLMGLVINFVIG
jgi:microcin C transport system permease protein